MKQNTPSISVITATYNAAGILPDLIESLRAQTDCDFEWIVIDGDSTDTTMEIVRNASDVVTHWRSEPDFGIYDALNKGVKLASGQYYLVVGADDRLMPGAIENYRKAAAETNADIITAPIQMGQRLVRWRSGPAWLYGQAAYVSSHAVGSLFRKKLHETYGYYSRKYPLAADQLFIKSACKGGASLCRVEFIAGEYGDGGSSSVDTVGALSEVFRVQLATESKFVQVVLFILRLIKNYPRL